LKDLPLSAQVYIFSTALIGVALCITQFPDMSGERLWLLLIVSGLAGLAQIRKVAGPTPNSYYDLSLMLYGFALLELGRPATLWIIVIAHLIGWAARKHTWYGGAFNIGMFVISMSVAGLVYAGITAGQGPHALRGLLGIVAATLTFTLINQLMLGLILFLASRETLANSAVFDRLILTIDTTLFAMGTGAALIWMVNPYAVLLIVMPLYLIYTTLQVPALQRQAESDAKTGLFNARHFSQALQKELDRADRFDRPLTVVMTDLDYLRNVNNTYGHLAGDVVLIGIANIIRESAREYDLVARFGGEEFAFLMPETTPEQALPLIESIRAAIQAAEFPVSTSPTPLQVTMSFGVAGRQRSGQKPEEIVHNADLAVYQAKQTGRNRVCLFSQESHAGLGRADPPQVPGDKTSADTHSAADDHIVPVCVGQSWTTNILQFNPGKH
jgi:diguanylate cyclase (GGDEF)-like protein